MGLNGTRRVINNCSLDPAEPFSPRRQTYKAIMYGGNRSDAFQPPRVDDQFAGLKRYITQPTALRARTPAACFATVPNPDAAVGPLRAVICCKEKPGSHHGRRGLAAEPGPREV